MILAAQRSVRRAWGAPLLLLCWLAAGCGPALRVYTSPALKAAHQRPRTIAILPLALTVNTVAGPGGAEQAPTTAGEAAMLQQMLYSIILQQVNKRPILFRNLEPYQLPSGALVMDAALAKRLDVEAFLVTRLHRTQTLYPPVASAVTTYNSAAATATATSTPAAVGGYSEVLLDMALYDGEGRLLWKYNERQTPWLGTAGRVTEHMMEEGMHKFPLRR
ncbi:MAG: hypothetical protein H7Z21_09805 [Hymenobacter sp.]|nr:hypothetical protein [Hymenobacter sp.]